MHMKTLSELSAEIATRRRQLAYNQTDMLMKIGMSQQQYQRIESGGDTRVSTLLRVIEGLDMELMVVPRDQVASVQAHLAGKNDDPDAQDRESEPSSWSLLIKDLKDE